MRILKNTAASALAALFAFSASNVAAQEMDPPPPSNFTCNGVTCEGWIITGYDPITDEPIYDYVVFADPAGEAPFPP